jgi:hypothetical protein
MHLEIVHSTWYMYERSYGSHGRRRTVVLEYPRLLQYCSTGVLKITTVLKYWSNDLITRYLCTVRVLREDVRCESPAKRVVLAHCQTLTDMSILYPYLVRLLSLFLPHQSDCHPHLPQLCIIARRDNLPA